jgi:hypothetical protein
MAANNCEEVAPLPPNFTTSVAPVIKSGKAVVDGGGYPKVIESPSATTLSFGAGAFLANANGAASVLNISMNTNKKEKRLNFIQIPPFKEYR